MPEIPNAERIKKQKRGLLSAPENSPVQFRPGLTLDHIDFHRFDAHTDFLEPLDGGFDVGAFAFQFQADDADLVSDAALANVGDNWKFLAELPDERLLDQLGRIHQPQTGLLLAIP